MARPRSVPTALLLAALAALAPDAGGARVVPPPGAGVGPRGRVCCGAPLQFTNWVFWWHYNRDEFLNPKARVKDMENTLDRPSRTGALVTKEVVPALAKVVADRRLHPDIRGAAVIALSRCDEGPPDPRVYFELARPESGEDRIVRESAVLALGIRQRKTPEVREFLLARLGDRDEEPRLRAFAAVGLGLLRDADGSVFQALERCLSGRERTPDVPVCALTAMGLVGDAKRVPEMIGWLEAGLVDDHLLDDLERSHLVSALGRIGSPDALEPIFRLLREEGRFARRSVMIALGQIVPRAGADRQMKFVGDLAAYLKGERDPAARNFGLMSLGRIGGRPDVREDVRDLCVRVLLESFGKGDPIAERPFAALALGLVCFEDGPGGRKPGEMKRAIAKTIRTELAKLQGHKPALGALAIALGLIGDREEETVALLTSILKDRGQEKPLRGAAAVALGLIGDRAARDPILDALAEREDRDLRIDAAVAAGLMGDSRAVIDLVEVLGNPRSSQFVLGSVALALGRIGDDRAIPTLLGILEPGKESGTYPDLTRALVAVALGQIADRRDLQVLFRLRKDVDYRASVSALDELLTIL